MHLNSIPVTIKSLSKLSNFNKNVIEVYLKFLETSFFIVSKSLLKKKRVYCAKINKQNVYFVPHKIGCISCTFLWFNCYNVF